MKYLLLKLLTVLIDCRIGTYFSARFVRIGEDKNKKRLEMLQLMP